MPSAHHRQVSKLALSCGFKCPTVRRQVTRADRLLGVGRRLPFSVAHQWKMQLPSQPIFPGGSPDGVQGGSRDEASEWIAVTAPLMLEPPRFSMKDTMRQHAPGCLSFVLNIYLIREKGALGDTHRFCHVPGTGGEGVWTIEAPESGTGITSMAHEWSWETSVQPAETFSLAARVK
jgi:hypothetical protein